MIWLGTDDTTSLLWTDYKIGVVFEIAAGNQVGFLWRAKSISAINNGGQQYWVRISINDQDIRVGKVNDGLTDKGGVSAADLNMAFYYNTQYILRVEAIYNTFDIYFNNGFILILIQMDMVIGIKLGLLH